MLFALSVDWVLLDAYLILLFRKEMYWEILEFRESR